GEAAPRLASGSGGEAAAGTARPGGLPQPRKAGSADELVGAEREAVVAAEATRRKQELEHLAPGDAHRARSAASAARIAATGAGRPHQRSNAAAPCWISISPPSAAGMPSSSA